MICANPNKQILSMYSTGRQRTGSMMANSTYSSSTTRRDVLWNVVEPGDPYDIRNSMIAQLPGGQNAFMGQHLEIVCLMQSAEIERLCEFLDDYKYRYREMERRELDRHSYEIQIKQLTQRLADESGFRSENIKLKDFIKRLTQENEDLKGNKYSIDSNVKSSYQSALLNIDYLNREIDHLKSQNSSLLLQSNSYLAKIEAIEAAKQREHKELFDSYASDSRHKVQMETISIKTRYESEVSRLEFQVKRLKQFNDTKNDEIDELSRKNRALILDIEELERKLSQSSVSNSQQVEERFTLFGQQIQRLNLVLKQSTSKIDEAARNQLLWQEKYHRIEIELRNAQQSNRSLEEQVFHLNGQLQKSRYEVNQSHSLLHEEELRRLRSEVQHLEQERSQQSNKFVAMQRQYQDLEYQVNKITILERENNEIKSNMANYQQLKRRVSQYENKIAMLSQEIERLTHIISGLEHQKKQFQQSKYQFEEYRRKSIDHERVLTQQYERQLQHRIQEYQTKIQRYTEQTGIEFDNRVQNMSKQMAIIKKYLDDKTEEAENHKRRIRELEGAIHSKYEVELSRKVTTYETTISELKNYSEDLSRKYRELQINNRRIPQYENKIAILNQQIQRLNQGLRQRTEQLQNTRKQLREVEVRFSNTTNMQEIETVRKFSIYEENQNKLSRQNEDLRRKLQEIVELKRVTQETQHRLMMSNQQIEKLSQALKLKVEALNNSEKNVRNMTIELENMKRARGELENNLAYKIETLNLETSRKVTSYQQNLAQSQWENEQLRRKLAEFSNQHNRKIVEYQNKIGIMRDQIERLKSTVNDTDKVGRNIRTQAEKLAAENQHLKATIMKYQETLSKLSRENEELGRALQEKEASLKNISMEYESFRRQVKEFEGQVSHQNSNISRQIQESKRRLQQYENRIQVLTQENQRLTRAHQLEQEALKRNIMELRNELNSRHETTTKLEVEASRKISSYEQNITVVSKERDELRRVLGQYENKLTSLVRELEESHRKQNQQENRLRQLNQEYEVWRKKYQQLEHNVTKKYEVESVRTLKMYEQKLQIQTQEIERYNIRINEYQSMRKNYQQNNLKASQEAERLVMRIRQLENSITQKYEVDATRKFGAYQQNIAQLSSQNEQLRKALALHEQNALKLNRELDELRRVLQDHGDMQRVIAEYDRQLHANKQDIERIAGMLQKRNEEYSQLEQRYRQDTEGLRRQLKETEINITNTYNQKTSGYEQNMSNISRENEQLRRRLSELAQEIETLSQKLRGKVEEIKQAEIKIRNLQQEIENGHRKMQELQVNSNKRFESEFSRTTSMYEQKTITITREYQSYVQESKRKFVEFENKIALLSQQLERATSAFIAKTDEARQLDGQARNLKSEIQRLNRAVHEQEQMNAKRFESQISRTVSTYQSKFTSVTREYEEYRRVNERKVSDFENKYMQLQSEAERLSVALRQKTEQNSQLDRNLKQLAHESDILKKRLMETEHSWSQRYESEVTRTTSTYEQNIMGLRNNLSEYERKISELNRKIAEDENKIAVMGQEIDRLNQMFRAKGEQGSHYQLEIKKYIAEIESLKSNISGHYVLEIEKLANSLRQKAEENQLLQQKIANLQTNQDGEFRQLQNSYSLMTKEYENSKKHLVDYEQSIKKLYSQFERLQIIINELKAERQTLFEKNHGLLQEIQRLTNIVNDQEGQLSQVRLRLTDEVALQKRINEHMALMVVLFAEIETLRQRIKDKEKEVKEVRRSSLAPFKA